MFCFLPITESSSWSSCTNCLKSIVLIFFDYFILLFFFSCPTCSFYVLAVREQQSYHPLSPPSLPLHPSHSVDPLCPSCCSRLRYDCRHGGCCCCCSDLDPRSGPDLCLRGDPGPRGDCLRCAFRSCRCCGGGGCCLRGDPSPRRVCPVSYL